MQNIQLLRDIYILSGQMRPFELVFSHGDVAFRDFCVIWESRCLLLMVVCLLSSFCLNLVPPEMYKSFVGNCECVLCLVVSLLVCVCVFSYGCLMFYVRNKSLGLVVISKRPLVASFFFD